MSESVYEKVERCSKQIRMITDFKPDYAIVLGSGLGSFADAIKIVNTISFSKIEGLPVTTVPGHDGKFIFGYLNGAKVVCMKGRVHYYEGYTMNDVVLPIRIMRMLGARILILTNSAGGIMEGMKGGDLMLINDHISWFVPNPLIGAYDERFGLRFSDMSQTYSKRLNNIICEAADNNGIELKKGIYCQLTGPSYETPAEIKILKLAGVGAVGMSTVVEAIAAAQIGMEICAISCITNMAAGLSSELLKHEDVEKIAGQAIPKLINLVADSVTIMHEKDVINNKTL